MRKYAILLMVLITIGLAACKKNTSTPTPVAQGFVNEYDQGVFNGLITAQAAINQAKTTFSTNATAKPALNVAIKAYNDARVGYLTWHNAAVVSGTADHTVLDNLMSALLAAIATLNQQFGVTSPAPVKSSLWFAPQEMEAL